MHAVPYCAGGAHTNHLFLCLCEQSLTPSCCAQTHPLRLLCTLSPAAQEERTLLIYVSRDGEPTRRVANEARLLGTLGALLPSEQLVVFNGSLGAAETIKLFQRAKVVMGPHGAGLSHALFSAPGTTVVEFLFLVRAEGLLSTAYVSFSAPGAALVEFLFLVSVGDFCGQIGGVFVVPWATHTPSSAPLVLPWWSFCSW